MEPTRRWLAVRTLFISAFWTAFGAFSTGLVAQTTPEGEAADSTWDVTLPRGEVREVSFVTDEGTWMTVDATPDGAWIVFDLLGHIYRVPAEGGAAEALTQESGVAVNYHPSVSPDGRHIAFVSDRGGQDNLWVMEVDGSTPRAVFTSRTIRVVEPVWSADGEYIFVRRRTEGSGIWMHHRDGGEGVQVVGEDGAAWPSTSSDGKHLYFHATEGSGAVDALGGRVQLRRLDLATGDVRPLTSGTTSQQVRRSSGGAYAPRVSPDGRLLAFARRIPDGTLVWKGHELGPRTALWVRDLQTGVERVVMDPIELDMVDGMKTLRLLPGYTWTADSREILLSQGGKLRRLAVASGEVETIPFEATVQRTISEQAYTPSRISDGPLQARFLRWHTASPDGRRLAFQAVGRIWIMELPDGTPRRLTPDSFQPFEFAPAWSPNGRDLAFTSWEDGKGGHVWTVRADGTQADVPRRLTARGGEYIHPAWSAQGDELVVARGAGYSFQGRTLAHTPWFELVRLSVTGEEGVGEAFYRVEGPTGRNQIARPTFRDDGRVYFPEWVEVEGSSNRVGLASVRPDGLDHRVHATFPYADEIIPSPDGRRVAFNEGDNVYVVPLPAAGTGGEPPHILKGDGAFPVTKLSDEGGLYPGWRDANTLEFGSGTRFYVHTLDDERTDTTAIRLVVPRDIPGGRLALSGARIITLDDEGVLEHGVLVVDDGRIACVGAVGECDMSGVDRVLDVSGTTIVPGFIDMHAHFYREYRGVIPNQNFEQAIYLAYGVTSALDNSMWSQDVFSAAELIEVGAIRGPRTFSTGDPLYVGDRSRQNEITSLRVARENVNRLASWGAISVKQYLQPRRDQRQWIAQAAREAGVMVTSEGSDLAYNLGMIMDGQTAWEHPLSYAPIYSDVARFFGQAQAVYSPTFVVGGPGPWNEEYFFAESDVWLDEKLRRWMPWQQYVPHLRRRMLRPDTDYSFPFIAQGLADIVAEGGWGAIGSHGQQHGLGPHWEIWMAASAMGPLGALDLASRQGAHFLGRLEDLGTLAPGKLADLVVLNSNPLDDIRNTLDIRLVMKGGVLWDGETLDEMWPRQRPFGLRPWVNADALRRDARPVGWHDRK